ncbi:MAG: ELM1/GtrOC1 family putative glycosyltransferase [Candidatus Omnitrophota bacterium]
MIDLIAYITVRLLNKIFALIPISISLWFGRRMGGIAFFFNRRRRVIAYANLKAAFAKDKSPRELRAVTKRVYQNMVQTFIEVLNLTKINKRYVDRYVDVINFQRLKDAAKSGRGTILLTAHFGDWELSSLVSSVIGFPIMVLVREQKMKRLNELLNRLRESNGCKVIRKGMSIKSILKALYGKNIVGILSDQDAGKNGMFVDFFGRPASCHAGPFEMAKHTGSLILPNFNVRTGGPYHKLYLEDYIDFNRAGSSDDIRQNLQRFTKLLESYIRKYPDQWLWLHKRWKSTPVRTVLVINDGRTGHLNQSLAVAREIQRARVTRGYRIDDTKIEIVDIRYKNGFSRALLSACAGFATWRCHGCMRCMKFCLEKESYDRLMKAYSDFVVSCGSGSAPVNIFMSKENNAKNVVVMKPGVFMGLNKFSLAVIPRHDEPARRKNVITTRLAPNLVDAEMLRSDGEKLGAAARIGKETVVGLLIGGDNPEFSLTKENIDNAIDNILRFSERTDADILATTSRRTPPEVEKILKEKLGKHPRCRLLIIANEKNYDFAVGGILSLAGIVVVSGESVSMVSEAVTSGKRVAVFKPEKKNRAMSKHEKALDILKKSDYITYSRPEHLEIYLYRLWGDETPPKDPGDREKIFAAVRRLI